MGGLEIVKSGYEIILLRGSLFGNYEKGCLFRLFHLYFGLYSLPSIR